MQALPVGDEHVFVAALHCPDRHTAEASAEEHVPLWSPSFGSAVPEARSLTHISAVRLQNWLALQSASTKQPPLDGTHTPPEHAFDAH